MIQFARPMRLGLEPDTDMLDRGGEDGIGDTGESARGVVLPVGQGLRGVGDLLDRFALRGGVAGFEGAPGVVEGAELDGDAGADAEEWGQGALVEGAAAFVLEDLRGAVQGAFVFGGGLEADFDDVFAGDLVSGLPRRGWGSVFWLKWAYRKVDLIDESAYKIEACP